MRQRSIPVGRNRQILRNLKFSVQINRLKIETILFIPLSTFFCMPFSFAFFITTCLLPVPEAIIWRKPFSAYPAWSLCTLWSMSHRCFPIRK
jgi:hypothetical protein